MGKKTEKRKAAENEIRTNLDVRMIPVSKINPAKYNPRIRLRPGDPEYQAIQASLREFGYVDPLIWNERNGNLVGGHQRYGILVDDGAKEIACSVVDLNAAAERKLNIALNKDLGRWDHRKLAEVVAWLQKDDPEVDLQPCGFTPLEADELVAEFLSPPAPSGEPAGREYGKGIGEVSCPKCKHEFIPEI